MHRKGINRRSLRFRMSVALSCLLSFILVYSGCLEDEKTETYYGRVVVPRAQEFRWSDGGVPQTFDPAFAAAPPDTDAVRAIFEGLTDYDPRSLRPVPAVAQRWESSNDERVWTFYLRDDARWSNGESVTAEDFVRSWQRTMTIGQLSPHTELLANIVGSRDVSSNTQPRNTAPADSRRQRSPRPSSKRRFGVEALGDHILRVRLHHGDPNFPALVAHSVFRPVKLKGEQQLQRLSPGELISNGAFFLSRTGNDRVLLERADQYWGRAAVGLQRVEFVAARDAEAALAEYRGGNVDAVSNAAFEPLALKLLTPYKDFRRTTYGALTYYSFNTSKAPFDDVRVREALAIAIDRERISRDDLDGATEPASRFLPEAISQTGKAVVDKSELLDQDTERARKLLAEAGFPNGAGFPTVHLLINRNEQQRIVAQSVAEMWNSVLGISTEIVMKTWEEYEAVLKAGNYDIARRGIVIQTTDEFTNFRMMFRNDHQAHANETSEERATVGRNPERSTVSSGSNPSFIESEEQALNQLTAMPIYFAASYSLVRPYVNGFDSNVLDVPLLKSVKIDTSWREPQTGAATEGDERFQVPGFKFQVFRFEFPNS